MLKLVYMNVGDREHTVLIGCEGIITFQAKIGFEFINEKLTWKRMRWEASTFEGLRPDVLRNKMQVVSSSEFRLEYMNSINTKARKKKTARKHGQGYIL